MLPEGQSPLNANQFARIDIPLNERHRNGNDDQLITRNVDDADAQSSYRDDSLQGKSQVDFDAA